MGKKKAFIDKASESTAHFHVVHRSQRDPRAADPDAPQRVLLPAAIGQRKGTSDRGSQSTRAWLSEQDLAGFEKETAEGADAAAVDDFDDLKFGADDDYDYTKHLLPIRADGMFIPRADLVEGAGGTRGPQSVAGLSQARSSSSRVSSMSRLSKASITLRSAVGIEDAFESAEELSVGVGGASNGDVLSREQEMAAVRAEMDPDLWACLNGDIVEEEDEEDEDYLGELNDEFVMDADTERVGELLASAWRIKPQKKKKKRAAEDAGEAADAAEAAEADDDDSGDSGDEAGEEEEEDFEEVKARATAEAQAAAAGGVRVKPKGPNPFKELFPSDDEDDEDVGGGGKGDGGPAFLAAAKFEGAKPGYEFKCGAEGQGYYRSGSAVGGGAVGGGAAGAPKRVNPFKEMFPSDDDEEEDDDSEDEDALMQRLSLKAATSKAGGARGGARAGGEARPERLLDERFDRLLEAEYSDEEIGAREEIEAPPSSSLGLAPSSSLGLAPSSSLGLPSRPPLAALRRA